jgi:hypothetical protein
MEMLGALQSINDPGATARDFERRFICPEESAGYAVGLAKIVFSRFRSLPHPTVIEFGSGTGEPVISAILNSGFSGIVHGFEIGHEAAETATRLIGENRLGGNYVVYEESFFDSAGVPRSDFLIANPPYIPCNNRALLTLPALCGGEDGIDISKRLLSSGYQNVFLEVSSYSNPVALIDHARSNGYKVCDFQILPLPLGVYSRQDIVHERIREMQRAGKAFLTDDHYLVGSALFAKDDKEPDLSAAFLGSLTAIGRAKPAPGL